MIIGNQLQAHDDFHADVIYPSKHRVAAIGSSQNNEIDRLSAQCANASIRLAKTDLAAAARSLVIAGARKLRSRSGSAAVRQC